jgi:hypothetical protein
MVGLTLAALAASTRADEEKVPLAKVPRAVLNAAKARDQGRQAGAFPAFPRISA